MAGNTMAGNTMAGSTMEMVTASGRGLVHAGRAPNSRTESFPACESRKWRVWGTIAQFAGRWTRPCWFPCLLLLSLSVPVPMAVAVVQEPVIQPSPASGQRAADSSASRNDPPANKAETTTPVAAETPSVAPDAAAETGIPPGEMLKQLQLRVQNEQLEQAVRDRLLDQFNTISASIALTEEHRANLQQLRTRMSELAGEAEKLRAPAEAESTLPDVRETETPQLETQLATLQVRITEEQQRLAALQERLSGMTTAKQTLQNQITKLSGDLTALPERTGAADLVALPVEQAVAELQSMAHRARLRAEMNLLETRLALLDAESSLGLFQLRVTAQERRLTQLTKELNSVRQELEIRRKAESEARLQQAQRDEEKITDPALRALGERITEIAEYNNRLVQTQTPYWQDELKRRTAQLRRIRDEGDKLQSRIDRFGASGVVGLELLRYHESLPSILDLETLLEEIEEEQTRLEFERLDYRDELAAAEEAVEEAAEGDNVDVQNLWNNKVALLRSVMTNNMTLFSVLGDLNAECRTMMNVISSWEDYISVQSLWFPSHSWPALTALRDALDEWKDLISTIREEWSGELRFLDFRSLAILTPDILIIAGLFAVQRRARAVIVEASERAARRSCIVMAPTLKTLAMTIVVAAVWPLVVMLLGLTIRLQFGSRTVTSAMGDAFVTCGLWFMLINFFRQTLRPGGLAESHFGTEAAICRFARHWLHQLILLLTVPGLLYWFLRNVPREMTVSQRLVFLLLMLLLALQLGFLWKFGRPSGAIRLAQNSIFRRFRWLWISLALLIPLGLAGLSFTGYHYTATVLARRIVATVTVSALLWIVHAVLERWLKVRRTSAAMEQARERASFREKAMVAEAEAGDGATSTVPSAPPPETDFEVLGVQAKALIRNLVLIALASVLWAIWYEVLPAMRVLSEYGVWSFEEEVAMSVDPEAGSEPAAATADDGAASAEPAPATRRQRVWVTFGDLMFAAIATLITFVSIRFLPGFLEVMLLSRVAFDAGVRYAIITVTRYVLLLTGVILVAQTLGIRWGNIQWLAAGLSVGLGFGLQEVFANFISGLIILFERPLRIGDIVTIDGVTGVVSKIRIRATSITDWDRRDYIVPNKEFVTGKLLNWTLTDTTNRFVLRVGVGYGADTVRARELMLEVAQSHPNILKDPAPVAGFENFGDSALNLMLCVFLPNMDNRLSTITELHTEILRRFAAEGIDIPYPQRSIHLVSDASADNGRASGVIAASQGLRQKVDSSARD